MSVPQLKEVQHRFSIETESQEYLCDDYIIYIGRGVQALLVTPDYTDCFMILGPILAIHDFASNMDAASFAELREEAVKMSQAERKPSEPYQDVGTV